MLITTTLGAHSSVGFAATFPILGKALNAPLNINLSTLIINLFREKSKGGGGIWIKKEGHSKGEEL